jgi:hypothetical protein
MGAAAFSQCQGKGTYDVLMDDRLSAQLTALWDCETLEDLRTHVNARTSEPMKNWQDRQDHLAQRAFLLAAQAYLTVSPEALPVAHSFPPRNEI